MTPIEIVYKTLYNYFVKKDGYNEGIYIKVSGATFLFNFLFLLNCYFIINIIVYQSVSFHVEKGTGLIISAILMIANHLLLFKLFKLSKNGDMPNNLFNIDQKTYSYGWRLFVINLLLFLIIPVLGGYIFKQFHSR